MTSSPPPSASAGRTAAVVIASTRAATGVYSDRTGPVIAEWLAARGFAVTDPAVAADGEAFAAALAAAIGVDVVITSGGTVSRPRTGPRRRPRRCWTTRSPDWPRPCAGAGWMRAFRPRCCPAGWPASRGAAWW
jgi:hypothetical protein